MSLRLEMLQVARLAPQALGSASDRIVEFLTEQFGADGGGKDRGGRSDVYYTVFALEGLTALQVDPPRERVMGYLDSLGDGANLDLVHLACLARCHASLGNQLSRPIATRLQERLSRHRSGDGGFAADVGGDYGTIYHAFLAVGAYQDLGVEIEDRERLVASILALHADDGSFSNDRRHLVGNTPTTAAGVALLRHLDHPAPTDAGEWLLARHQPDGGFLALPRAPMPDLLSTGTALHALASLHVDVDEIREPCLDFLDTLWTGRGFCGSWGDDIVDSEYTWYALLALGHLSLLDRPKEELGGRR